MTKSQLAERLLTRIQRRQARVGVVGLGCSGMALAVGFARAGFRATAIDADGGCAESIRQGRSWAPEVPDAALAALSGEGRLEACGDFDVLRDVDAAIICAPTRLTAENEPDLSALTAAAGETAARLQPGMLVVIESIGYPGATEEVVLPILEASGLQAGTGFFLAVSPARTDSGNPFYTANLVPRIVGGATRTCAMLAAALYRPIVDRVVPVSSTRAAEMVALLESTFCAVNTGLANEIAVLCDAWSVDAWEVIEAAGTKPFGFVSFYPGPGVGGPRVPVHPIYLHWKASQTGLTPRFLDLAVGANQAMLGVVIDLVRAALDSAGKALEGSRVLVAGIAYERDVGSIAGSPALEILSHLHALGALVRYSDPNVPTLPGSAWSGRLDLAASPFTHDVIASHDCVVVACDHSSFDYELLVSAAPLIVDTRNAVRRDAPQLFRLCGGSGAAHSCSPGSPFAIEHPVRAFPRACVGAAT